MVIVGDDWAEGHHDIELMTTEGQVLARFRVSEDTDGLSELLARIGRYDQAAEAVFVGIERDNGPWVTALRGYGFHVYGINPVQAARCRARYSIAGAKSDVGEAHVLADMVRTDRPHLRLVADDSDEVEALKVLTRTHKALIWERTRHLNRLRYNLIQYYSAALDAFEDPASPECIELLTKAPDPSAGAALTPTQLKAALKRAGRRNIDARAATIRSALRADGPLRLPAPIEASHAAATAATLAVIATLQQQINSVLSQVTAAFDDHPCAAVITSLPGMGQVLGARVLAEFGDAPGRYRSGKARRNFAGTSPITKASGKRSTVSRRHVHNDRLLDALTRQAFTAIRTSPGARAYYVRQRERGVDHNAALWQVANRFVSILHGCLKHAQPYEESIAWANAPTSESAHAA